MAYERCKICGEYGFTDGFLTHRCKPTYEVRSASDDEWDIDWRRVRADSPREAAEKWLETFGTDGDASQRATAIVRDRNGALTKWDVQMEYVPSYCANEQPLTDEEQEAINAEEVE